MREKCCWKNAIKRKKRIGNYGFLMDCDISGLRRMLRLYKMREKCCWKNAMKNA